MEDDCVRGGRPHHCRMKIPDVETVERVPSGASAAFMRACHVVFGARDSFVLTDSEPWQSRPEIARTPPSGRLERFCYLLDAGICPRVSPSGYVTVWTLT